MSLIEYGRRGTWCCWIYLWALSLIPRLKEIFRLPKLRNMHIIIGSEQHEPWERYVGFSDHEAADILVQASGPRSVQRSRHSFPASHKENRVDFYPSFMRQSAVVPTILTKIYDVPYFISSTRISAKYGHNVSKLWAQYEQNMDAT